MTANEYVTALDWLLRALCVSAAVFYAHRARRSAREAKVAERTAWMHTANTLTAERRLEAMLPPDVIAFEPPAPKSPAETPGPRDDGPDVIPFPFKPRLHRSPRGGGA